MTSQSESQYLKNTFLRAGIIAGILITAIIGLSGGVTAENANYGWFKVVSSPASGEVIFDGQSYGQTPALIKVNSDAPPTHEIIVIMDGYEEYSQQVSYNPGTGETVPIVLDASQTLDHMVEFLNKN